MLYLKTIKDKYVEIYNEFISQLHIYAKAVRILAKGYLPISLITPLKLQEILNSIKETLTKTYPDYDIVIKRLHIYYDMKLVTFGIDRNRNLIIQFPIFVATLYTTTINIIQTRNSSRTYCRQKHYNRFLHSTPNQKAILSFKYRNIHAC